MMLGKKLFVITHPDHEIWDYVNSLDYVEIINCQKINEELVIPLKAKVDDITICFRGIHRMIKSLPVLFSAYLQTYDAIADCRVTKPEAGFIYGEKQIEEYLFLLDLMGEEE